MPVSPSPPPTPPKDHKTLSPVSLGPYETKKRSSSFSKLLRPQIIAPASEKASSPLPASGPTSPTNLTEKDTSKLSAKVKDFFSPSTKRQPSSSSLSSSTGASTAVPLRPSSPARSQPPGTLTSFSPSALELVPGPGTQASAVDAAREISRISNTDQFRQAIEAAQTSVDRLQTASDWLGYAATALALGGAWLPMVGHGVQAVANMLDMAKEIGVSKVAALRLVEKCARILEAVIRKLKSLNGEVSLPLRQDINRLLTDIHNTAFLLTKLANRPFFKLWLHAGEVQDQIAGATAEIELFFAIFNVEAAMSTNSMLEQAKLDREADQKILRDLIQAGIRDEDVLLRMLVKKSDEQQEAIKTLQRALDNLRAGDCHDPRHSPGVSPTAYAAFTTHIADSPAPLTISLPPPNSVWLVDPSTVSSPCMSREASLQSTDTDLSHMSVQAQKDSQSPGDLRSMQPEVAMAVQSISSVRNSSRRYSAQAQVVGLSPVTSADDPRRQFIEKALDVLRRHSASTDYGVPDWTITSLEITHELRLKTSFFSTVWRGRWQGEQVAIKELNSNIDRELFITEVEVWRRLRSKHVLPFFGASSTTGPPPWFMVSPYMRNGNALEYLRKIEWAPHEVKLNMLTLVLQIAEGMEYLHSRDILHGDFKASNVLISDIGEALICDFGLSQLKSDLTRRSEDDADARKAVKGTMRWQSPERLAGEPLTAACDVYSFAITTCELYYERDGEGTPFGRIDDVVVRQRILDGLRPSKPVSALLPKGLWKLVERCWAPHAKDRPTFEDIVKTITAIKGEVEQCRRNTAQTGSTDSSSASYSTAPEQPVPAPEEQHAISPQLAHRALPDEDGVSSSSGSIHSIPAHLEKELSFESDRAERHYRHYLTHDFDDRLTIPLWFPSQISLGDVGYIRHGQFIKLFSADRPPSEIKDLPPMLRMEEFEALQTKKMSVNAMNMADKGWEMMHAVWTSFIKSSGEKSQKAITRRYTFPLKPGGKQASLIVDDADFEIYRSFTEPRAYLLANIDWILHHFGDAHHIVKEDIIVVVGTLSAHNYAFIVSNFAPRTTLTFNVHAEVQRVKGEPWGTWTVNRQRMPDEPGLQYTCKVSTVGASPKDAVLLAKLKFPPGADEPSLYP